MFFLYKKKIIKNNKKDWCENNYEVSYFIAEFWNTTSSLAIVVMGLFGIYMVWKYKMFLKKVKKKN